MKANIILLFAVLFAFVFYTSSLTRAKPAVPVTATGAQKAKVSTQSKTGPQSTKGKAQANTQKPKVDPGKTAKKTQGNTQPAKPAPFKLCSFNKLGTVPGSPVHKFSVLTVQQTKYENKDFDVTWKTEKNKHHRFFSWVEKLANFAKNYPRMKCQVANKAAFGKTCNYQPAQLDQFYANAFGKDIVFRCTVPENSFVLSTRFVLQLSDFATSAGGRWSVFGGLYQYRSEAEAKAIIKKAVKDVSATIKSSKLTTFDINSNLNIIPEFVKGTLSWIFTSNINRNYVKTIQKNKQYDISDVGYLKILPPGTEFIIGSIYNGTTSVKQICDNYDVKDNCNI